MKKVGIWLDKREAKIVSLEEGNERLDTIVSYIEDLHESSESGAGVKVERQDVVKDSKYSQREKHILADFFKEIVLSISDAEAIVIFGPAQTGEKLYKELKEKNSQFANKTISIEKADNMTENQIIAWVKNHHNSDK